MFFYLIYLVIFGLIVGYIAKAIHPGEDPQGWIPTVAIGICGSFLGGFINFLLGTGAFVSMSGFFMSILGGVLCCALYRMWENDHPFFKDIKDKLDWKNNENDNQ